MLSPINSRLVLASGSPRRQQLLSLMGLSYTVAVSQADETPCAGELPQDLVARLSRAKAASVAGAYPDGLIIAADTIVVLDGDILGKPTDEKMAWEMLTRLRSREHTVYSGLALVDVAADRSCAQVAATPVHMRHYTDEEILRYIASGDPLDKAGAYAIQHPEFDPIERIGGCYANVMGLPMCHLYRVLLLWQMCASIHPLQCCPQAVSRGCPWSAAIMQSPVGEWGC